MKSVDPIIEELSPLNVACPFVGILEDRTTCFIFPSEANRCHSDPDSGTIGLSLEHQTQFCLSACHTDCPRLIGTTDYVIEPDALQTVARREVGRRKQLAILLVTLVMIFAVWRLFHWSSAVAESINSTDVVTVRIVGTEFFSNAIDDDSVIRDDEEDVDDLSEEDVIGNAQSADKGHDVPVVDQVALEIVIDKDETEIRVDESELILSIREPGANLRATPSTDSEIIQLLSAASEVVAKGRTRDFWFFIEVPDGKQGWVTFSTVEQADAEAVSKLPLISIR